MNVVLRSVSTALLILIWHASPAVAAEADIDDLEAVARDGAISISLQLKGALDRPETIESLQSGLPVAIVYQFDLIRKRENWFDRILSSSEIELVATYNSLTREYLLNYRRDRKLVSSQSIRTVEELRRRMTTIREEALLSLGTHRPGDLRVRARAVLGRRYLLHVIPRAIATEWDVVRVETGATR